MGDQPIRNDDFNLFEDYLITQRLKGTYTYSCGPAIQDASGIPSNLGVRFRNL